MDDPEALGVSEGPLEVVEQRPDEVATDGHAVRDRAGNRVEVRAQMSILSTSWIRPSCVRTSEKAAPFSVT
jgi:hypothetical protein